MKKLRLFALIGAVAMLLTSCGKDSDFLIGKWNLDKMTIEMSMEYQGEEYTDTYAETDLGWIEFKSGGEGVDSEGESFTWALDGDQLTISDSADSFTMTLTTKTDTNIVGEWSETETEDGVTIDLDIKLELSKI